MEYSIKEIVGIIGAKANNLQDSTISILLTDSRRLSFPEQSLFFALKTKTNDGHRYIKELYKLRVRNFVVSDMLPEFESLQDANFLVVKDTLKALQKLAAYHRKRFNIPVIGITGSNGKTIVKEFLYQLLHREFNIVRSPRSYNSQLGVPLSVWQMSEKNTLGIFEAGISQPDEMENLRPIIAPTIGIITNIGEAHQENFISTTQKCLEKLTLFNDCEAIIYDGDDAFISNCIESACLSHKAIAWSRTDSEAPLYIEAIEKKENETVIRCTLLGLTQKYVIPFTDDASIENVIHCLAVMLFLKPTSVNGVEKFAQLEPVAMRLDVKQGINNCMLINDTYNSDINSLDIALDFQQSRHVDKNLKCTLILSDILQSGTLPKSLYKKVADLVRRKKIDRIIGIGRDLKEYGSVFDMEKEFYNTTDDFLKSPTFRQFKNELILLKGSRHFHFERISELLEKKVHETILEVNLDAVVHNFNYYRSKLKPETKMVCMVKAFGYGAGSYELAKTLQEHRCDYLAVAVADEGAELRKEGISIPIIVMNPEFSSFNVLFENNLEPEIYSFRLLDAMIKETERRGITSYPIHIKIDTGMHRLGFQPGDVPAICERLKEQSGVTARSVFSHLVGSDSSIFDDFTKKQLEIFSAAAAELENLLEYKVIKHILNSAGIERFTDYQMDMVRLGIGLYGVSASGMKGLRNVSTLRTTILQIQHVPAGDSIGYSRKTYVDRDSRIAIIPIGYADGLDRHFSNRGGEVSIGGKRCPIVGNICMDACMIDVTDTNAQEGDPVIVFGEELPVSELSDKLKTIPYEILTSVSPRVKRVYYRE
ncbi:bifunctional UDP-N-acetylmuramoyl-tripeptide:D-alanyl-D-alanine ligase/alanine racemase [Parabacteroides gordonii]|uniref:Alanine racemase n=1 Tax=Parabacteroides gordonii MS-1 = DSM 23371 TaxID=1203610 RepID=A0A0F5JL86_9BACT|nr:bifunctional UDP-N-acetylmuramoyl-tripeptide:D-alanyl-D-alanine ligase/alanine racemase [Parabacteroides gordonii]KKB58518.1 alanine racemase [Parabacteroides gordonii MS-1 = DSM 23371]MCA5583221.1 bifunctional UDP-N-acetylmuramoyl-tripeptide:D-alanyl-D-alanine ligase/alanine racemase [Parabacteroides gordonii]RGP17136.1 bifunctional UDP-N-acetylmuramoyl-tripeptide:D-alanyl-D-alanine ligase/alanine racemase [Parabacteroides gordonii]